MKKISTFFALLLFLASSSIPVHAAYNGVNPSVPGTFGVYYCVTATQLDCIESVQIKENGQESFVLADYKETKPNPFTEDELGNLNQTGTLSFSYNSGQFTKEIQLNAYLSTPKRKLVKQLGTPSYAGGFSIWV